MVKNFLASLACHKDLVEVSFAVASRASVAVVPSMHQMVQNKEPGIEIYGRFLKNNLEAAYTVRRAHQLNDH